MDCYLTNIDITDIPNLNDNYNLPPPYNKILFKTRPTNPAIKLGIKTKYNYNEVHNIRPWSNICQRVHNAIQPYLNGKYRIYSSWLNYYKQGNAVQWHHHIRQLVDINTILFLTDNPSPLLLSPSRPEDKKETIHTIQSIAGNVVAFKSNMAHMVPECEVAGRWTLTTNFICD